MVLQTSSIISAVPKEVEPKKDKQKNAEACPKIERDDVKLSSNRNLKVNGEQMCIEQAAKENDATPRGSSDNENGDVSASESDNGYECEPEDDENDVKAEESEVEADEIEGVAQFSDRFLWMAKLLAIKVATESHGKEDRIFKSSTAV